MKILIAIDGSVFSDRAVEGVARRPWPPASEIRLISVVEPALTPVAEPYILPTVYWEEAEKAAEEQAQEALNRGLEKLRASHGESFKVTAEVLKGYPKQVILEEAERWNADLIVVGSHGRRGLTRLLLGSVSQAVAAHATCSV
ncbi:MAG TPA: universal stress protein, partial [Blastocatellia bacterium]|nr:universal stress protein [Blastocatellia bacterium]